MKPQFLFRTLFAIALLSLFVGCAVQDIRQLDEFKELADKEQYDEIVKQKVDCTDQDKGCDQLRLIHGMACYQLAKQDTNPKANYQCSIDDLRRGLDISTEAGKSKTELKPYSKALLESIRERQDLSVNWSESAPYTELLRTQSERVREIYPNAPDGYYYGATAAFAEANKLIVQNTARTTACDLLSQAKNLVEQGSQNPGEYAANFEQTGRQINRTLQRDCSS